MVPALSGYYSSLENAKAELDFVVQHSGKVILIEVKAAENLHAKSLRCIAKNFSLRSRFEHRPLITGPRVGW